MRDGTRHCSRDPSRRGATINHPIVRLATIQEGESLDMRIKSSLANHVCEQLGFLGRVTSRSIFGGTGIFCQERLLAIVIGERVYLHTDKSNLADYESRGMPQFKPYPNAFDLTTDHHQVPQDVLEDDELLKQWGQRALTAAIESARSKQLAGIERSRRMKQARRRQRERAAKRD